MATFSFALDFIKNKHFSTALLPKKHIVSNKTQLLSNIYPSYVLYSSFSTINKLNVAYSRSSRNLNKHFINYHQMRLLKDGEIAQLMKMGYSHHQVLTVSKDASFKQAFQELNDEYGNPSRAHTKQTKSHHSISDRHKTLTQNERNIKFRRQAHKGSLVLHRPDPDDEKGVPDVTAPDDEKGVPGVTAPEEYDEMGYPKMTIHDQSEAIKSREIAIGETVKGILMVLLKKKIKKGSHIEYLSNTYDPQEIYIQHHGVCDMKALMFLQKSGFTIDEHHKVLICHSIPTRHSIKSAIKEITIKQKEIERIQNVFETHKKIEYGLW